MEHWLSSDVAVRAIFSQFRSSSQFTRLPSNEILLLQMLDMISDPWKKEPYRRPYILFHDVLDLLRGAPDLRSLAKCPVRLYAVSSEFSRLYFLIHEW